MFSLCSRDMSMPDLSTLTTLKDLETAGWGLVLQCNHCGRQGELSWSVARAKIGDDLNIAVQRLDKSVLGWKLKPVCSKCKVRGQATLRYVPPLPVNDVL